MTAAPPDARHVEVPAARLARWLDGFATRHGRTEATRHGATEATGDGDTVHLFGADGAQAWLSVPFGPLRADTTDPRAALLAHVAIERRVGVLLVRRGGYAAGLFDGDALLDSKVGTGYVQGTTKAGGWSQQRYARRRANQADAVFGRAADAAARVLTPAPPTTLVAGGDREAVRAVLADPRLAALPSPAGPWLEVKDPRLPVLRATPERFRAVRIALVP